MDYEARERERDAAIMYQNQPCVEVRAVSELTCFEVRAGRACGEPVGRTFRVLTMQRTHTHGLGRSAKKTSLHK